MTRRGSESDAPVVVADEPRDGAAAEAKDYGFLAASDTLRGPLEGNASLISNATAKRLFGFEAEYSCRA